jgi:tetratricopeptide (TPR) repeat protein
VALPVLSKALAKEKKQPNLWMTYAATLHDLNRWEEAEKGFLVVHNMLPQDPMPLANIGATYIQRGEWREAINWCDKALALDPDNHIARISKGFGCLSLGRWKDAWKYNEALYGNHLMIRHYTAKGEPEWDGSKGKTVVVQCDQGLGDQIMFAQCLPQISLTASWSLSNAPRGWSRSLSGTSRGRMSMELSKTPKWTGRKTTRLTLVSTYLSSGSFIEALTRIFRGRRTSQPSRPSSRSGRNG